MRLVAAFLVICLVQVFLVDYVNCQTTAASTAASGASTAASGASTAASGASTAGSGGTSEAPGTTTTARSGGGKIGGYGYGDPH